MRTRLTFAALFLAATVHAQNVVVSVNPRIVQKSNAPKPGEAQSTVVPPGLKSQCTAGRFLVTNDSRRPPEKGLVTGRDLDKPAGPDVLATFDNPPGHLRLPDSFRKAGAPERDPRLYPRYRFVTNDHDLVSLHNGDVLYLTGAASRSYVETRWFAHAYRKAFGPGARSVVLTWRSTDCGETFHYVGEFDPARIGDGSCALPQFRLDADGQPIDALPYDMGGADGQTVHVDSKTNRLYLTFSCVGFRPFSRSGEFKLDPNAPLNKTLVAVSDDDGASWSQIGAIDFNAWRVDTVPLPGGDLGFGIRASVVQAQKEGTAYAFNDDFVSVPNASWGWPAFPIKKGKDSWFYANNFGHTLTARTPGSNDFFIVYATKLANGYGFRMAFYDRDKKAFADADDDIAPAEAGANNFVMHPVAVDNGAGPVLIYWNDVDFASKSVTVRGRFVFGPGAYSSDFTISRDGAGQPRSFTAVKKGPPGDWYGDYQTAGGFRHAATPHAGGSPGSLDVYYPVWIEPDGVIRFARVEIAEAGVAPNLRRVVLGPKQWRPQVAGRPLSNFRTVEHE